MVYISAIDIRVRSLACLALWYACISASAQCPSLTVIGPRGLTNPGDEVEFRAAVLGDGSALRFAWTVTKGKITRGSGTSKITVATGPEDEFSSIDATVTVDGFPEGCKNTAFETAVLSGPTDPVLIDEFSNLPRNEVRGRLDSFLSELVSNPSNIGLVVLRVKSEEGYDSKNARLQFIVSHLKYRKFDKSRIWFSLEKSSEPRTTVYRYPEDVMDIFIGDNPVCKPCLIIKGGDL